MVQLGCSQPSSGHGGCSKDDSSSLARRPAWFTSRTTNGLLEGINSLIQAAKAKARGYRTSRNLIAMVYLIAGKLELNVTHLR
jgi:hypothetical protein